MGAHGRGSGVGWSTPSYTGPPRRDREKVLALQQGKRALADAIVRAEHGPIATLTREDLTLLLG